MNCTSSAIYHDEFNVGDIVWARRDYDGFYWPGKINFISNNVTDTNHLQYELWSYLIQFFQYDQTHWTVDILPYRQYRDYMLKNLLVHYESYPQIKYQFLNAINQADINENSNSSSFSSFKINHNYNYIPTSNSNIIDFRNSTPHTTNEYSMIYDSQSSNIYHQYMSNYPLNNYCSYCTQPSHSSTNQLTIETNLNPIPQLTNQYHQLPNDTMNSQTETFQKITSVIIITTKSYANSSFISYIFKCFSTFLHHSIIYIDDLTMTSYQHPNTSNIYYLICFDHFDSTIKQILNSTILNNLNAHINYLFLVLNAPSNDLIKHLYSTIMDKRTIHILHYHSTFENEPLLLCSGNRRTFEMIQSTILKFLCSKIKYIESQEDNEDEQLYSVNDRSFEYQSNNIKNEPRVNISNQTLESNSFINNPNISNEHLGISSIMEHSKKLGQKKLFNNLDKRIFKRKLKQHLSKNRMISVTSSEYYVQNILDNYNSSK